MKNKIMMQGEILAHGIEISDENKLLDKPALPGNSAGDSDKPISEQGTKRNEETTCPLSAIFAFFWNVNDIPLIGTI